MISIKDYASSNGITYEAVRKQVKRYEEELQGHIHRQGRTQYLDDIAVAILNDHRASNPVAIYDKESADQLFELQEQVNQLLVKTAAQADRIAELASWKAENALLIAGAAQTQLLLDTTRAELDQEKAEHQKAQQQAAEAVIGRTQAEDRIRELELQFEQERARRSAAEEQIQTMKDRGLLARILRRGE